MKSCSKFLALLMSAAVALVAAPKLSKDLKQVSPDSTVDVIVQFKSTPTEKQHGKIKSRGGSFKSELHLVNGGLYSVPAKALDDLALDADVVYISPDREVSGSLDHSNPTVNANLAFQNSFTGNGVGIAIIDSGVTNQPDLSNSARTASRIVYQQSFVSGLNSSADQYGHGTHVAGVLAGNATQSTGSTFIKTFRGMASNANLINLRVLDASGKGTDSAVISAINQAISLKSTYNIRVINLSLGRPVFESYTVDPLCQAVEKAWRAGIVVVVAAGNEGRNNSANTSGYGTITSPANDPLVITVGAMKDMGTVSRGDDLIASYSSKGPTLFDHVVKPDIVAPGNRVIALNASGGMVFKNSTPTNKIPWKYYQNTTNTDYSSVYYKLSGTSVAAPFVSGAAAVLIQKDPTLTPDTIKARLMKTASKSFPAFSVAIDPLTNVSYQSQYDIFTVGAGYLDIWAALNSTDTITGNAASPIAKYDTATGNIYVVNASSALWGTSAVWGTSALWGTSAVWGTSLFTQDDQGGWGAIPLWGASAVWGTGTAQGFSALWGTSAVWGTSISTATESLSQLINGEN